MREQEKTFKVTCNGGCKKGEYCLSIETGSVHASLSTHDYNRPGNSTTFNLYSMTCDEVADLATQILSKAFEVREREEK